MSGMHLDNLGLLQRCARSRALMDSVRATCVMSNAKAIAMASLTRVRNHTWTLLMSFQAPRAAKPAYATSPRTEARGIPVPRLHTLLKTA